MVRIACFPHKNRPLFPTSQLREFAANAAIMPIAVSLSLGGDREMRIARFHSLYSLIFVQAMMQSHEVSQQCIVGASSMSLLLMLNPVLSLRRDTCCSSS